MKNKYSGIEDLIEKLPKNGMSRKCQRLMKGISLRYFKGEPREHAKQNYGEKNRGFVDVVYRRLDHIKEEGLKRVVGFKGGHINDYKGEGSVQLFSDAIIDFCINRKDLEKKLAETLDRIGVGGDFLKKYREKGKKSQYRDTLKEIAKNPYFYSFILENIINRDKAD